MLIQETKRVYDSYRDAANFANSIYDSCIALAGFLLEIPMPENGGYQFTPASNSSLSGLWQSNGWQSNGDSELFPAVERSIVSAFEKDLGVNPVKHIFVTDQEGKIKDGGLLTAYAIWPIKRKDCYMVGALATTRSFWQREKEVFNRALWAVNGNIESFLSIGASDRNHKYSIAYPAVSIKDKIDLAEPLHLLDFGKVYAGLINKQR
jgi:hypothetical protein